MNQKVLDHCKQLLEKRKEELHREQLSKDNSLEEAVGELSTFDDNHPADMGTELFEREKDISIDHHLQEELAEIEHALEAIVNETYPFCEKCGKPIDEDRLLAIPTTRYCMEHGK